MTDYRPFLKWVGGKRQLLPALVAHVSRLGSFGAYHEPFVGGGALFFQLRSRDVLPRGAVLSDVNARLVEAYQGVANSVDEVIEILQDHARNHSADHFYAVRKAVPASVAERAARMIYLNRTCFNGLYRENRKGEFNVPIGRYANPRICNEPVLRAASEALRDVSLKVQPFEAILEDARPGDLVYFDPPYVPLSRTASFTAYARDGFQGEDQSRLAAVFGELASRGIHVMLSNSRTEAIIGLYSRFNVQTVLAGRAVNSRPDRRGKVEEVIVSSF